MEENSIGGGKVGLERVEELIEEDKLDDAQAVLDGLEERDGRWHFVQAKLFIKKNWINEARKQLEIAIKLEPDNAEYITAYDNLKYHAESGDVKTAEKGEKAKQMGEFCAECGCECCAAGCIEGLCSAACDGCG